MSQKLSPPEALTAILQRADACYVRKDWDRAREYLSLALEVAPGNAELLNALASLHYGQKDYAAALPFFVEAARLAPQNANVQVQLGMTYLALNQFREAEDVLLIALQLRPGDPLAQKLLDELVGSRMRRINEENAKYENDYKHTLQQAVEKGVATVGRWTYGNPLVKWWGQSKVQIGSFCSIADGVTIMLGGEHFTDRISTFPFSGGEYCQIFNVTAELGAYGYSRGDVVIGNDVWLASGATIMSGVNIGHGAVVAANAVVTKDVPPYTIAGGVPAKSIRQRFSDGEVAKLLEARWWDLPDRDVGKVCQLLYLRDVDALVSAVNNLRNGG